MFCILFTIHNIQLLYNYSLVLYNFILNKQCRIRTKKILYIDLYITYTHLGSLNIRFPQTNQYSQSVVSGHERKSEIRFGTSNTKCCKIFLQIPYYFNDQNVPLVRNTTCISDNLRVKFNIVLTNRHTDMKAIIVLAHYSECHGLVP